MRPKSSQITAIENQLIEKISHCFKVEKNTSLENLLVKMEQNENGKVINIGMVSNSKNCYLLSYIGERQWSNKFSIASQSLDVNILHKFILKSGCGIDTNDQNDLKKCDVIFVCVPTPITKNKVPNVSYIENATNIIMSNFKNGSMVILKSTTYPGTTEEIILCAFEKNNMINKAKKLIFNLGWILNHRLVQNKRLRAIFRYFCFHVTIKKDGIFTYKILNQKLNIRKRH